MYRLNLFCFDAQNNEWRFLGKHTPEQVANFELFMPNVIFLTNGW